MRKRIAAFLAAAGVATVLSATPAQAHVACGMTEHWKGHGGAYLVDHVRTFQSKYYGEVQVFAIKGGRTWSGSYPVLLGYRVVSGC